MNDSHKVALLKKLQASTPLRLSPTQLKLLNQHDLVSIAKEHNVLLVPANHIYISLDHTLVKSSYELLFSNFLYMNHIAYEYDKVIQSDTLFRYDFKINGIFLEFFCYYGEAYEKRVKEKKVFYSKNTLPLKYYDVHFFKDVKYHILYEKFIKILQGMGFEHHHFVKYDAQLFISGHKDYLKYFSNVLQEYISQNNTIPSSKEFREMNLVSLERIVRFYGGSKDVCKLLELDDSKFRHSWENQSHDDLINKYLEICTLLKRIPYDSDFYKLELTGFLSFLRNNKLKEEFEQIALENGFSTHHQLKYDGNHPIKNLDELITVLLPLCEEFQHIPTRTELEKKKNLHFVNNAISNFTSRDELSTLLGYPTFNDIHNIKSFYTLDELVMELGHFVNELGHFPTQSYLEENDSYYLKYHIYRYGGSTKIAKLMNVRTARAAKNWKELEFWNSPTNVLTLIYTDLLPVARALGYIPNEDYLRKNELYDLSQLINKMGGRIYMSHFLEIPTFNEYHNRKELNYWDPEGQKLKQALLPYCDELGYIPSHDYLIKANRNDLIHAINTFKGNLQDLMGFHSASTAKNIAPKGSNYDISYLEAKLKPLIEAYGHFPTPTQLRHHDLTHLEKAIKNLGNRPYLADAFGTFTFTEWRKLNKVK